MQTALLEAHLELGGKIVDFFGWKMPLQYKGILHEHQVVRSKVGIFDVSHMGRIFIEGLDAESFLDFLSTNAISGKKDGTAIYTVWCSEAGMSVDDLIIYKISQTKFFVIVNAANREKDLAHLLHYSAGRDLIIQDHFNEDGILAIQGPKALTLISQLFPDVKNLKFMHFVNLNYKSKEITISRTGYTGEDGVEIYAPNETIVELWGLILREGSVFDIEPIGLAARDTLRLEMGYALYGHELSDKIMPIESVSAWTVRWDKADFLGKHELENCLNQKKLRHEYGIILNDKKIAREGCLVYQNGQQIGSVTSGTFSPTLSKPIAIVLVEKKLQENESVDVLIRENFFSAQVVSLPFYSQNNSKNEDL